MIKKQKDNDAAVTKGMLDDAVAKISAKIDEKVDGAIGDLAIMVEKGFQGMAKQMDSRFEQVDRKFERIDGKFEKIDAQFKKVDGQFDKVFSELKETRKEIGVNELKTRGDVAGLDFRVGKLEKKAGL
jgi:BMFP domain-containing protein YqiC